MTSPLLFHIGRKTLDALDDFATHYRLHLGEVHRGALGCAPAQVALATFRAHEFTGTSQAKPFGGRLMGLQLGFASFRFAWHCKFLLSENIRQNKTAGLNDLARGLS